MIKIRDTGKGWKIGGGGDGMEIAKNYKASDLGLPMAKKPMKKMVDRKHAVKRAVKNIYGK